MKRKEQTPKATKPEPTKKINEEVGDDTQIEGTDLTKEVKLNIWPQKIAKGSMMSIWRNPQAFNNLFTASLAIFIFPLLSIFLICKTNVIFGPEVDIDTRILWAGGVSGGFVVLVMIIIVIVAILEPEPEWAKELRKNKEKKN